MNTAGSGKQVYAAKEGEPKQEEKKPEVDPIKQALSELDADNDDNLIDSFISESKG